jgi:hypothetical protein
VGFLFGVFLDLLVGKDTLEILLRQLRLGLEKDPELRAMT